MVKKEERKVGEKEKKKGGDVDRKRKEKGRRERTIKLKEGKDVIRVAQKRRGMRPSSEEWDKTAEERRREQEKKYGGG